MSFRVSVTSVGVGSLTTEAGWSFASQGGRFDGPPSAIFPIVRSDGHEFSIIGTGFYISSHGILVTAKHCFQDHDGQIEFDKGFAAIHMFGKKNYCLRPFTWGWHSDELDVSVCIAAQMSNSAGENLPMQTMTLTAERPPIGTEIVTYAYPNSVVEKEGTSTRLKLHPDFFEGRLIRYYPTKRDNSLIKWPCYETSMKILPGTSGGPVCNASTGRVFAINTTSLEGSEDHSFVTPIDVVLDAEVPVQSKTVSESQLMSIRDLAEGGHLSFEPPLVER